MPSSSSSVADMQLRGPDGLVHTQVHWPDVGSTACSGLPLLVAVGLDSSCVTVGLAAGCVVLSGAGTLADAVAVTGWAADHAAELGADPRRLVVAGAGGDAALAAAVARRAQDEGWPPLARQVLVGPCGEPRGPRRGMAPATVVDGMVHAAALRAAGVDVDEVDAAGLASHLARTLGGS